MKGVIQQHKVGIMKLTKIQSDPMNWSTHV
jgi:hypothetical protein